MARPFLGSTPSWWSSSTSSLWKLKDTSRTRSRSQLNNENAVSRTYTFDHGRLGAGSEDTSGRFSSRPRFIEDLDTQPWAHVRRMWTWTRIGLGAVLLSWSTYCAVRYYIAVRGVQSILFCRSLVVLTETFVPAVVYDDDPIRSKYAIALGAASISSTLLFLPSFLVSLLPRHVQRRIPLLLSLFAAVLLIAPTVINLVLLNIWRFPRSATDIRTIHGRCRWDVDVVWTGTGQSCAPHGAPFGAWLAASISRFIISLIAVGLYVYVAIWKTRPIDEREEERQQHTRLASQGGATPLMRASLAGVRPRSPTPSTPTTPLPSPSSSRRPATVSPVVLAETRSISEEELQRRSLSFTAAGHVLSRIELPQQAGSDDEAEESGDEADRVSNASSERSRRTPTPTGRRTSTSMGGQGSGSTPQRVQVVGAYVQRMSTIDSVGTSSGSPSRSGRGSPASERR
ncbi:hypothetical protein M422DRAFT_48895 [Sphaerobolus stellatus SS14]|uniref:Uncharacterized protein n=1 Tax=Sphaerobolus stellatus (strain SS14) TaxID=990650 RepID=A0A0C9V289_SPHS4|nr:hypothetical protein M422DRAFT_48895 [Sphaerobolus stellatus SS14]